MWRPKRVPDSRTHLRGVQEGTTAIQSHLQQALVVYSAVMAFVKMRKGIFNCLFSCTEALHEPKLISNTVNVMLKYYNAVA